MRSERDSGDDLGVRGGLLVTVVEGEALRRGLDGLDVAFQVGYLLGVKRDDIFVDRDAFDAIHSED